MVLPVERLTTSLTRATCSGETGCGVRTTTQATVAPWREGDGDQVRPGDLRHFAGQGFADAVLQERVRDGSAECHGESERQRLQAIQEKSSAVRRPSGPGPQHAPLRVRSHSAIGHARGSFAFLVRPCREATARHTKPNFLRRRARKLTLNEPLRTSSERSQVATTGSRRSPSQCHVITVIAPASHLMRKYTGVKVPSLHGLSRLE